MIKITTRPADSPLFGQSKWWGQPDMPAELDYPEISLIDDDGEEYSDPLTFVCQLRCDELSDLDPEGMLPHQGMLYFFAALDYFLGDTETPAYPGLGLWQKKYYKVLYAPSCDSLHTHSILFDDGTPACMPPEAITFSPSDDNSQGIRMLCPPFAQEVREQYPAMISLLQIDEDDRWNLLFHDCGMLSFLMNREHLQTRNWEETQCYLYSC